MQKYDQYLFSLGLGNTEKNENMNIKSENEVSFKTCAH